MMRLIVNVLFVIIATGCFQITVASVCKPKSTFKVDCNICTCSSSGVEYSCTNKTCPVIDYNDKYSVVRNKQGYIILKPKPNNEQFVFDDDNEFVLNNRNTRKTHDHLPRPYPYIKDEISYNNDYDVISNNIDDEENNIDDEENNIDDEEDNSDEQSYVDADLEETRRGDIFDNNINKWDDIVPRRRDY